MGRNAHQTKLSICLILLVAPFALADARADSFQIIPGGITFHTPGTVGDFAAANMGNKLTSDGLLARNPGIGFLYFSKENEFGITGSYIQNCFGRPAGWIAATLPLLNHETLHMYLLGGVYMHLGPDVVTADGTEYIDRATPLDVVVKDNFVISPLVGLYVDKDFPLFGRLSLTPSVTITPALSFFTMGFKVTF